MSCNLSSFVLRPIGLSWSQSHFYFLYFLLFWIVKKKSRIREYTSQYRYTNQKSNRMMISESMWWGFTLFFPHDIAVDPRWPSQLWKEGTMTDYAHSIWLFIRTIKIWKGKKLSFNPYPILPQFIKGEETHNWTCTGPRFFLHWRLGSIYPLVFCFQSPALLLHERQVLLCASFGAIWCSSRWWGRLISAVISLKLIPQLCVWSSIFFQNPKKSKKWSIQIH